MNSTEPVPYLRSRLSILMFLQFATWGAWAPVLGNHLTDLHFTGTQIGLVYLTGALGCILSPVIGGQIADRWFPTQIFLSLSFFATAVFLYFVAQATTFWPIFLLALGSMIFFGPTLALSNSLSFHHMSDPRKDYPVVRLWGTLGWIAVALIVSFWLGSPPLEPGRSPVFLVKWFHIDPNWMPVHPARDALYFGAAFALLCGIYSFTLPNTPPRKGAADQFAMWRVLGMLKDPSFAVFCFLAFSILLFAAGYYNFQGVFFKDGVGFDTSDVPIVAMVGQIMEIVTMLLLPWALKNIGTKGTIAIGIFMWGLRFAIFGLATAPWMVVVGQSLHGFCFAFAIAASMIYTEKIAAPDLRGSVQSFLVIITYGFGMLVGSLITGPLKDHFSTIEGVTDWHKFWLTLAAGCGVVFVMFLLGFRPRDERGAKGALAKDVLIEP